MPLAGKETVFNQRFVLVSAREVSGCVHSSPRFLKGSAHPIAWLSDEVVGVLEGKIMALTFHPS